MNRFKLKHGIFSTMTLLQFDFFSILQCDFFVLNKDTEECHIGERMSATSTLSDETDKRPAYVNVGKIYNHRTSKEKRLKRLSFLKAAQFFLFFIRQEVATIFNKINFQIKSEKKISTTKYYRCCPAGPCAS